MQIYNNYDRLANVVIDIENPIVDENIFGNVLIIGPLPATAPATAPALVGEYKSLKEVKRAGWAETDPVGMAAKVAFAQNPVPEKIFIAPIQMVTTGTGNEAVTAPEEPTVTLARALDVPKWFCCCPVGIDAAKYPALAEAIEPWERMLVYTELNFNFDTKVATVDNTYFRTTFAYGKEYSAQAVASVPEVNNYMNVAMAIKCLSYQPGSETWAFKQLAMVKPSTFTEDELDALDEGNGNYFITVGRKNVTMNGKTRAGEWIDVIRFRDWLQNDIRTRVANVFLNNPKVPYTDKGIGLIHNALLDSLKQGQLNGGIVEDEFTEDGTLIPGYVTSVPLAAEVSAARKQSRKLVDIKFRAKLAGAIHFADIHGSLTYEL